MTTVATLSSICLYPYALFPNGILCRFVLVRLVTDQSWFTVFTVSSYYLCKLYTSNMNSVWHGIIILQRDCRCDSRQFEDYTEEEEQKDWKKEETNKAIYDANILLHQLHTCRIVLESVHRNHWCFTLPRTPRIRGLNSQVLKLTLLSKNDDEKYSRTFFFEIPLAPLQPELLLPSAKNLPRGAELVWQVSRYLWRG